MCNLIQVYNAGYNNTYKKYERDCCNNAKAGRGIQYSCAEVTLRDGILIFEAGLCSCSILSSCVRFMPRNKLLLLKIFEYFSYSLG